MAHHDTESQIRQGALCQHFVVLGLKEGDLGTSQNYKASDTLKRTAQDLYKMARDILSAVHYQNFHNMV